MNEAKLDKLLDNFVTYVNNGSAEELINERNVRKEYYQSFDRNKIINISDDDLDRYLKKLWNVLPMQVNNIIKKNGGYDNFKRALADFLYGKGTMKERYDNFHDNISTFKASAMSEDIPKYSDNLDFACYKKLINYGKIIKEKISTKLQKEVDFLDVDLFYEFLATKELNSSKLDRIISSYIDELDAKLHPILLKYIINNDD